MYDRITIVGGGTTGILAAFYFAKNYPEKSITWIYPEENNPIGVGEGLVPQSSEFIRQLGFDHQEIIKFCNGTLKLGGIFDGWYTPDEKFFFPFGVGEQTKYNGTSHITMMKLDKVPDNILDYPDMATHFRTTEFFDYLENKITELPNLKVIRETTTKEKLQGTYDLLIDSTGFGRYISKLPDNFVDLSHIIPNNCALTCRIPYTNKAKQLRPYSLFKAMEYGWCWHTPLGDRLALGYVHDNKFDVRQEFIDYVSNLMEIEPDQIEINSVPFITGRNKVHLKDNVVAIGLASAFIEPLESTGIYLIVAAIQKISQFIEGKMSEEDYNRLTNENFDAIVNFIVAHYKYTKRDNEYWNHYKNIDVEQYKTNDIFPAFAWDFILSGFKIVDVPKETVDPHELINISRGIPYHKWLESEQQ